MKMESLWQAVSQKNICGYQRRTAGNVIKGSDVNNPILLYLHGGMPDYFLTQKYPTGLEETFTVAWWEQRGTGLSYSPDIPQETMNVEQMVADTIALTNYLRQRYGVDKIYLMGHSGGTFIGIRAAAPAPEAERVTPSLEDVYLWEVSRNGASR